MKNLIITFHVITGILFSQGVGYLTKFDLPYLDKSAAKDDYARERCVLDLYYPSHLKKFGTIVWFHGGGLTGGNKHIPSELKNKELAVVAPNYRLHPKVKAPVYIEDAAAAVAWVFKTIESYGGNPEHIYVAGHSAGGYLVSMIGLDKSYLAKHGIDADKIAGLIPFSGHTITHFTVRKEMGIDIKVPVVDKYAPLHHVRADAPPLTLITGDRELELVGRYEENAYLARMMKIAGHKKTVLYELDGYGHSMAYPAYPLLLKSLPVLNPYREKIPLKIQQTDSDIRALKRSFAWEDEYIVKIRQNARHLIEGAEWESPNDLSAKVGVKYNHKYLYFAFLVTDNMPFINKNVDGDLWQGDNIEVFLSIDPAADIDRQKFTTTDFQVFLAPGDYKKIEPHIYCMNLGRRIGGEINVEKWGKGYWLFAALPWEEFGKYQPKSGDKLGFSMAIDDADQSGSRDAQAVWFGSQDRVYRDPSQWNQIILE